MLKRKRSGSELSSSPSSTSSRSSDGRCAMDTSSRRPTSHLPSRTMKRFRDSRPSDDEVHERTLGLLYSARQPPPAEQAMLPRPPPPPSARSQQTLHSFWNINSPPSSSSPPGVAEPPSCCDDCGGALAGDDAMDLDADAASRSACGACAKNVCPGCSVSNLGDDRRCLACAGAMVWVGGIGWTGAGVSVR